MRLEGHTNGGLYARRFSSRPSEFVLIIDDDHGFYVNANDTIMVNAAYVEFVRNYAITGSSNRSAYGWRRIA